MSFKVYKNGNLILVDYEPRNGADFLYKIFELDIDDVKKDQIEKKLDKNQQKFESCDFSKINSLFVDNIGPDDYIKNGIRLLKETLSPKIFQRKASYSNRATFMLGALDVKIGYYRIPKFLLTAYQNDYIGFDVLIHKSVDISKDLFFHDSTHLYFEIIDLIKPKKPIVIGGSREDSIPIDDFKKILESLPTRTGYQLTKNILCQSPGLL